MEKMRQDRYEKKPLLGVDKMIFQMLKGLKFEENKNKGKEQTGSGGAS